MRTLSPMFPLVLLTAALGCDPSTPTSPPPETSPKPPPTEAPVLPEVPSKAPSQAEIDDALAKAKVRADMSPEAFEILLHRTAACEFRTKLHRIDNLCEAYVTYLRGQSKESLIPIGRRNLNHASPAVRLLSLRIVRSITGLDDASADLILKRLDVETHPTLLAEIARTLDIVLSKRPAAVQGILRLSRHTNPHVRKAAALSLSSMWAKGTKGTLERALEILDSDPDITVREATCANIGMRANDLAIDALKRYTTLPAPEPALYDECFMGLVKMWSSESGIVPNQRAYDLTMERLRAPQRSATSPPWTIIPQLRWVTRIEAPWFKPQDLQETLTPMILDKKWSWLGRTSSLEVILDMGATAKDLQTIKKQGYANISAQPPRPDGSHQVVLAIERHLQRLKKK